MKIKYIGPAHERADELLVELFVQTVALEVLQGQAEAELAAVQEDWALQIKPVKEHLAALDRALRDLMKKDAAVFFAERDKVELPHGALLRGIEEHVKKARGVLAELERLGLENALKRTVAVNWDELQKWPEEKLIMVGTERLRKEVFAYEIKGVQS